MKLFLLYYDTDYGCREEWNTFYTPVEVFLSDKERDERIELIKSKSSEYTDDDHFYKKDVYVMTPELAKIYNE